MLAGRHALTQLIEPGRGLGPAWRIDGSGLIAGSRKWQPSQDWAPRTVDDNPAGYQEEPRERVTDRAVAGDTGTVGPAYRLGCHVLRVFVVSHEHPCVSTQPRPCSRVHRLECDRRGDSSGRRIFSRLQQDPPCQHIFHTEDNDATTRSVSLAGDFRFVKPSASWRAVLLLPAQPSGRRSTLRLPPRTTRRPPRTSKHSAWRALPEAATRP